MGEHLLQVTVRGLRATTHMLSPTKHGLIECQLYTSIRRQLFKHPTPKQRLEQSRSPQLIRHPPRLNSPRRQPPIRTLPFSHPQSTAFRSHLFSHTHTHTQSTASMAGQVMLPAGENQVFRLHIPRVPIQVMHDQVAGVGATPTLPAVPLYKELVDYADHGMPWPANFSPTHTHSRMPLATIPRLRRLAYTHATNSREQMACTRAKTFQSKSPRSHRQQTLGIGPRKFSAGIQRTLAAGRSRLLVASNEKSQENISEARSRNPQLLGTPVRRHQPSFAGTVGAATQAAFLHDLESRARSRSLSNWRTQDGRGGGCGSLRSTRSGVLISSSPLCWRYRQGAAPASSPNVGP